MNVTFYNFTKRRNSTKQPTGGTTYTCLLKDDTSTSRPSIEIKWDGTSSAPASNNYCYIADFGRYYWVDSWTYSDRKWIANCTVDVLATYKTQIGSSSKYVLRAASYFDPDVIDTLYSPKGRPWVYSTSNIMGGFPVWADDLSGGTIIIGIIGMDDSVAYSTAGASYYKCTPQNYMKFLSDMFTESLINVDGENYGSTVGDAFKAFSRNLLRSVTNPTQYIKSAMWFPFTFSASGTGVHPKVGGITSSAVFYPLTDPISRQSGYFSNQSGYPLPLSGNAVWPYIEPFVRATVHFPPFGTFPIDMRKLEYRHVYLQILVDAISGQGSLLLYGEHPNYGGSDPVFATTTCQIGVPMDFSGVKTGNVSVSQLAGTVASASAGDMLGAAAGVANMIESAVPVTESRGSFGGIAGDIATKYFEIVAFSPTDEDPTEQGKPLCRMYTISDLSGFVMCADGEVNCNATESEHRELEAFLTGGFFYE